MHAGQVHGSAAPQGAVRVLLHLAGIRHWLLLRLWLAALCACEQRLDWQAVTVADLVGRKLYT